MAKGRWVDNKDLEDVWCIKIQTWDVYKKCEVNSSMTLEELCPYILNLFNFDNDHLHRFYLGRKTSRPYSHANIELNENKEDKITLKELLPNKHNFELFMHFDFGDDWIFRIMKYKKDIKYDKNKSYPFMVEAKGVNPEQYPDYEDDDWDE